MKNIIGKKNIIGFSGGIDSTVLLHQLVQLREQHPEIHLRAIYINHQLSENAERWGLHCESICKDWDVEFEAISVNAKPNPGESPEAAARNARYRIFFDKIQADEYLLTAHNADDQVETVFLQLLRGAGPKGLSAMPEKTEFTVGFHARPLLSYSREEILRYAKKHNLVWIEDESNLNNKFDRNFLRNNVIPLLKQRWPQLASTVSRSARHCAEAKSLLEEVGINDLVLCQSDDEVILISALEKLSYSRQKNAIRTWLDENNFPPIDNKKIDELLKVFLKAREDQQPLLCWENIEVRRHKDKLFFMNKLLSHDPSLIIKWDMKNKIELPNGLGTLDPKDFDIVNRDNITVRFRQGGEVCRPVGRKETHTLKHLFQEWDVPAWYRDRIPLIYVGNDITYVVGYCKCNG